MLKIRKYGTAVAAAASLGFLVAATPSASAATVPPWHEVYSHHFGPAANDYSAFSSVLSFGKNNVWALGGSDVSGGGTTPEVVAVHWTGRGWSGNQMPAGIKDRVIAASADSASDIWAVTFNGGGYVLHYNGSKWSVAKRLPGGGLLSDVTAISPRNVWVFGTSGYGPGDGTWHYDGTTWKHWTGTYDRIGAASAVSASNIWGIASVIGPNDTVVHFNGRSWTKVAGGPTGISGYGIAAFSANNVWLSAQKSTGSYLLHYTGRWSSVKVPWGLRINSRPASDGAGGLWFTAFLNGTTSQQWYEVHWQPGNKWTRDLISGGFVASAPTLIPGTSSLAVGGFSEAAVGGSAVVWVHGQL